MLSVDDPSHFENQERLVSSEIRPSYPRQTSMESDPRGQIVPEYTWKVFCFVYFLEHDFSPMKYEAVPRLSSIQQRIGVALPLKLTQYWHGQ